MQLTDVHDVVQLMKMEYAEMPELKLTGAASRGPVERVVRARARRADRLGVSEPHTRRRLYPTRRLKDVSPRRPWNQKPDRVVNNEDVRSFWRRSRRVERTGYVVGALLLASGLIHLAVLAIGGGSWQGPLSLRKPTTFGLSFGLTLITIVWVASFLRLGERTRAALLGTFTIACVLETALVSLQAWRSVPSHFNMETTFDALIARALAAGGIALVAIIVALTITAFRANPTVPPSLRIAIQIGFIALVGAMVTGALMIAKGMMLVIAGDPQAAYAAGGMFKPTHAVTMHAILILPLIAWLLSFASWSEQRRLRLVLMAAAAYIVIAGAVAVASLAG